MANLPPDEAICGDRSPLNYDHTRWATCRLPKGHSPVIHREGDYEWTPGFMPWRRGSVTPLQRVDEPMFTPPKLDPDMRGGRTTLRDRLGESETETTELHIAVRRLRRRALMALCVAYLGGLIAGHLLTSWISVGIQFVVVPPLVLLLLKVHR